MSDTSAVSAECLSQAAQFGLTAEETKRFVSLLKRCPSLEELAVCGALWSEHCSYKSSRVHLKRFHTHEPWVLQGPGENAGVVAITDDYGIAFKMESHNHPSYIEPYQGAATGVGGILRDVFCMGALPIANLNCLRFGEGAWNSTLLRETVRGIGDYGNSVGVPTVGGDLGFHTGYNKNILVNAMTAGIVHKDRIFRGVMFQDCVPEGAGDAADSPSASCLSALKPETVLTPQLNSVLFPESENTLICFGSATGRDGVHGATMSSSEFSDAGGALKPTVQVGDPFAEKVLLEATLALLEKNLVVGLQDMGAAGLTSSSVEMAGRSGCGVAICLNQVPKRASNMLAYEILLSESQERMLCAVAPNRVQAVLDELARFDISAAVIGKVNRTGLFVTIFDNRMTTALPVQTLLDDVPRYSWPVQSAQDYAKEHAEIRNNAKLPLNGFAGQAGQHKSPVIALRMENLSAHEAIVQQETLERFVARFPDVIGELFSHPAFASRSPVFQSYCATVQGNTVAGCGALQSAAAAVVRLPRFAQKMDSQGQPLTHVGIALAAGCEERLVELNPLHGAALSVLKVARKVVATGAIPLALTDCLNFGSPKSPAVMRQLSAAIDGINWVAKDLGIPVVSGNVSLNNQTDGLPIPPTPMIGIVGKVDDVRCVPLSELQERFFARSGHGAVYLVHVALRQCKELSSYQASRVAWLLGGKNSGCPTPSLESEKLLWRFVRSTLAQKNVLLSFPVGKGGVLGSVVSLSLKSDAQLELFPDVWQLSVETLCAEGNMGFIFGFVSEQEFLQFSQQVVDGLFVRPLGLLKPQGVPIKQPLFDFRSVKNRSRFALGQSFQFSSSVLS